MDTLWFRYTNNTSPWNVIRIDVKKQAIALLSYPDFETVGHPELACSLNVSLRSRRISVIDFTQRTNKPVIHRKELFIHPNHNDYSQYRKLTIAEEQAGLLSNSLSIGYNKQWQQRLQENNMVLNGHTLKRKRDNAS